MFRTVPLSIIRNCPKHVEFYSKNKFEKLVHLFGFIMRNHNCTESFTESTRSS